MIAMKTITLKNLRTPEGKPFEIQVPENFGNLKVVPVPGLRSFENIQEFRKAAWESGARFKLGLEL